MSEQKRGNSIRNKHAAPPPSRLESVFPIDRMMTGPRNTLAWGILLLVVGGFLEIAFLSHIFTGANDQSTLDALQHQSLREVGRHTSNALGILGAVVSQVFVYRWFGVAALLLPVIPLLTGWTLLAKAEPVPLGRTTKQLVFYTLWISALMGFVVLMSGTESGLSYLSGGFGYTLNVLLFGLLKWGSIIVIVLALFLHVIFFYNVTSLDFVGDIFKNNRENRVKSDENGVEPVEPDRKGGVNRPLFQDNYDDEEEVVVPVKTPEKPAAGLAFEVVQEQRPADTFEKKPDEIPLEIGPKPRQAEVKETPEDELSDQIVREFGQYDSTLDLPHFKYPDINLLTEPDEDLQEKVSHEELESNKNRIVETLGSYGIKIAKIKATIGPTVTLYEIIPEAGVRIAKIQSLEKDIALGLRALGIRIIAPMPGRGTIGIEVPNKKRETVYIRSVLSSERFQKSTFDLPVVLGKTISNEIHVADLAKMPHLLMAGATGQGKSVGLNVLLASLIYKKHPSQLKFVLVDPKKVELTLFNKLERHYLAKLPNSEEAIITDTKKVIYTLNSLCIEMDSRYDLLKEAAVRNLKEYNAKFVQRKLSPQKGHRFLPFIVLVIDELADLMMTAGKEVETPIARLAQLARAVGIHLVVATQRPSVKVITGLIKANFPARLSFRVTSSIDSRTILDMGGAEQLVGQGDMLLSINSEVVRLQCPFIDTREVERICDYVGNQRGYDEAYALPEYEGDEGNESREEMNVDDFDSLLPEAARLVVVHQQGSTSLIQRKMKLGYNRAGRIMDQLEMMGIVGAFTGSKAREVLFVDLESLEQHLKGMGVS